MSTDVHFSTIICQCFLDACVHLYPKGFAQAQATRKLAHTHAHAPARARTNSMHARICCLFDDPGMWDADRKSALSLDASVHTPTYGNTHSHSV